MMITSKHNQNRPVFMISKMALSNHTGVAKISIYVHMPSCQVLYIILDETVQFNATLYAWYGTCRWLKLSDS